jgi:hypothetical protein
MPHYVVPSEFLFWTKNKKHQEHKAALLELIYKNLDNTKGLQKNLWFCDVNTEFFSKDSCAAKYINLVVDGVYPALDGMFSEVPSIRKPKSSVVRDVWYNHYDPLTNSGQEVHTHTTCSYSGIYFLELSEPNTTMFFSHLASVNEVTPATKTTEFIEEGDILLFPSTMMHYVLPAKQHRTTIAFNIVCNYEN